MKRLEEDLSGSKMILWDGFDYLGESTAGAFTKEYFTIDSQIMAARTASGRRELYADALGSISAESISTTRVVRQWYTPYGGCAWINSTHVPERFQWVGSWGYRDTSAGYDNWWYSYILRSYVRARHYSNGIGRWTTVDPLYPDESAYGYVGGLATKSTDSTGRQRSNVIDIIPIDWSPKNCHTGKVVPPKFIDPPNCFACAAGTLTWWPTPAHLCNGCYAHCMACCVLTRLDSPFCAETAQGLQNILPIIQGTPNAQQHRIKYCNYGIELGRKKPLRPGETRHSRCDTDCSKACPPPNPLPKRCKHLQVNGKPAYYPHFPPAPGC